MTKSFAADWLEVKRLGPAQRLLALRRLEDDFDEDPRLAPSKPAWERAIEVNERAAEDQRTFERNAFERPLHKQRARDLDVDLDRLVGVVHGIVDGARQALPEGTEARDGAEALYKTMFPRGLAAIVQQRFVQQHQLVLGMLEATRDDEGRPLAAVKQLGLATFLRAIEKVNAEYGQALSDATEARTYDDVRELDAQAYRAYAAGVLAVIAAYPSDDPAEAARRNEILRPVSAQEAEAKLYRRRRRADGTEDADAAADDEAPTTTEEEADDEVEDTVA